ncbi:c-type cytochrome [Deinococcus radiophilus]|uniref:Cytochrome c n=2 Tax=Deinococcus radiophilus TaxID=32062 RepID=A0A3S0KDY9_9DEIO|nr:cytochrome c [Deinococcus radiophilus]RTR28658.1 cytochrome c [Deinococcus radiophilus]UFA51080.1 cytochrome c [Deinococcus radiophilus]
MSLALLLLLLIMVLAALAVVILPLLQPLRDPLAQQRSDLLAERDQLYAELLGLPDTPEQDHTRTALEVKAARVLRRLDELPAAPPTEERLGRSAQAARIGWLAAVLLTASATLTFVPQWQKLGLDAAEAAQVTAAQRLPGLRAAAQAQPSVVTYNAWGDAAFEQAAYSEAMRAYTESLKLETQQAGPLRRLGTLLLNREDMGGPTLSDQEAGQAFALIRTAAQLAPDEAESHLLLGYALVKFGQEEQALTALERYRELNPQGRDADELISSIRTAQNSASPALALYAASCASCHGPAGGGGLGPSLRKSNLSREAAAEIIQHGQGSMPAYPDLQDEDLEGLLNLLMEWQADD